MKNFPTCHSHIGSLDTGSSIESFVKRELELGTGYITTTDHGVLGSCKSLYDLAKEKGLKPILGLEAYLRDDNCEILGKHGIPKTVHKDGHTSYTDYFKYGHITLHAKDQEAYQNLSRVLSRSYGSRTERHGSEIKPLFTWADLEELGQYNITAGSGCLIGVVQRHLLNDRPDIAAEYYLKAKSCFKPGNFYVEVFPHRCDLKWEQGVFIEFVDGTKMKVHESKKFITDFSTTEIEASDLAKQFLNKKHKKIISIKNYRTWEPVDKEILDIKHISGFIQNECTEFAPDGDVQLPANKFVIEMAKKYGDKIIISDDSHIAYPEDKIVQDIRLTNSITGHSWKFATSYHRQSSAEAHEYFSKYVGVSDKEFESWIDNSLEWASNFDNFELKYKPSLPVSFYPTDTVKYLNQLITKHGRMDWSNELFKTRLKEEIDLLRNNGHIDLLPYFFLCEDLCSLMEEIGEITGPGRGSAAGLLLTYLLGITHINPLPYKLSKERFLTVDRILNGKLPDIDMDFTTRDPLIDPISGFLSRKFKGHFAQISTNTSFKIKNSILDVNRALNKETGIEGVEPTVAALAKAIPPTPQGVEDRDFVFGYTGSDYQEVKGILETDPTLKTYVKTRPAEWDIVQKLFGITKNRGRHASGFVVVDQPISSLLPLQLVGDVMVTQYTAEDVEACGGIKLDLLLVNSLNDIRDCIQIIQKNAGLSLDKVTEINGKTVPKVRVLPHDGKLYDIWELPNVLSVFNDICESKTETVFQFNTPSARRWLQKFDFERYSKEYGGMVKGLKSIEDLALFTSLDRPGPLDAYVGANPETGKKGHNMLAEFAIRAKGEPSTDAMPILNELLPETHGIICYQEQLQHIFQVLGGTNASDADNFRLHISKKQRANVIKDKEVYMKGAVARLGETDANKLWDMMETYANYGFNKSHAISYAVIGYATAFLKHFYPLEWWASVLSNAKKEKIVEKFWKDCFKFVKMPDINKSNDHFEIEGKNIRAPISLLTGIGQAAQDEIEKYRPYTDIKDFCQKIQNSKAANKASKGRTYSPVHSGIVNKLIISGIMDSLFPEGMTSLEKLVEYNKVMAEVSNKKAPVAVSEKYENLNAFQLFLAKKAILPIYSEELCEHLVRAPHSYLRKSTNGRFAFHFGNQDYWIVSSQEFMELNERTKEFFPGSTVRICVVGYACTSLKFKYHGTKQAFKTDIDLNGERFEFLKWPDKRGILKGVPDKGLTGSVTALLLSKSKPDRPFVIDEIFEIEKPIED